MSFLANIGSMFAQPTVQAIAAGLLSGAVIGSTVVASGILAPEREEPKLVALLACPGGGPELARVPGGQQLLITARSEDGAWLEVYLGEPGAAFAWVPAPALRASSALDALPISRCETSMTFLPTLGPPELTDVPITGVPATVVPTVGPTLPPGVTASPVPPPTPRITATPKPTPTKTPTPTPSKTPTPTPSKTPTPTIPPTPSPTPFVDNTPPVLSDLTATGDPYGGQYYIQWPTCGYGPYSSTVQVTATDPDDAVSAVVLYYQATGESVPNSSSMSYLGSNRWQATITSQDAWAAGLITYYVRAGDSHGNWSSSYSYSASYILNQGSCGL